MIMVPSSCCLQVKEKIATDQFKPNCALVVLDFLMRHGLITPDSGKDMRIDDIINNNNNNNNNNNK